MEYVAIPTIDLRNRVEDPIDIEAREVDPAPTAPAVAGAPGESRLRRGTTIIAWEAAEYVVYKKTTRWYVIFGVVLALLLFSAFLLKSFLTGVVFFLCGVLVFLYSERTPRRSNYEIRDTGILIGNRVFLYRELTAFNLIERGDVVYILLVSRRPIMPLIHVPVADDIDPNALRELLLQYLPEDEQVTEPFADVLAHWLGF